MDLKKWLITAMSESRAASLMRVLSTVLVVSGILFAFVTLWVGAVEFLRPPHVQVTIIDATNKEHPLTTETQIPKDWTFILYSFGMASTMITLGVGGKAVQKYAENKEFSASIEQKQVQPS